MLTLELFEKWSQKYKKSIDCSHPKGFSQKAHCAGRKKHNESIEQGEHVFIQALRDFLPIAANHLKIKKLPKIKLLRNVDTEHLPSFGKFSNEDRIVHVDVQNRHPNDILRTLAHELTHYAQGEHGKLDADSWKTGSPIEDDANAEAGVIMRMFNKKFPQYMALKPIVFESIEGSAAEAEEEEEHEESDPTKPIPFPKGTTLVNVSDVYDWYKLGMAVPALDKADPDTFNKGVPHTVFAFGSEEEEHRMMPLLKRLGFTLHDIDSQDDYQKAIRASDVIEHLEQYVAENLSEAEQGCPPATQDISLNLKNRQKAIDEYHYGPLNPNLPNDEYWQELADKWNTKDIESVKQNRCGNCGAFDVSKNMQACIAKGIGSEPGSSAMDSVDAGHLGYCKFLKFKCASKRTCDAWIEGGPITEQLDEDQEKYILYLNDKPVATYSSRMEANNQAKMVVQKFPTAKIDIKKEVCTLSPVQLEENLRKWFKEKWVRFGPDGKIRGSCARGSDKEGKPKCLPQSKAHALGKKGRASAAAKKRREDPDPERRGPAKNVATKVREDELDENCWKGYHKEGNKKMFGKTVPNCVKNEGQESCPECGGIMYPDTMINEKQDACYYKVKSRYKVWPSAYASGALVQCRKKGAKNWGNKTKKESVEEGKRCDAKGAVPELKAALDNRKKELNKLSDKEVYAKIDKIMSRIAHTYNLTGQELHDMWTERYGEIPDTYIIENYGRYYCSTDKKWKTRQGPKQTRNTNENFADGKGPGRPGDSQRHGIPKGATMAQLEKAARAPGRKGQLARWQINMRRGKKK